MTKEQKLLLLFVLIIGAVSSGAYMFISNESSSLTENNRSTNTYAREEFINTQVAENTINNTNTQTNSVKTVVVNTQTQTVNKTFKTTLSFEVPKGHVDSLTVSVLVDENGIIKDVNFNQQSSNHESEEYYDRFSSSFSKSSVIGKNINSVSLSRIGGASLTTNAFNDAIKILSKQL